MDKGYVQSSTHETATIDFAAMVDRLERIAADAGALILDIFERGPEHTSKHDGSPVTEADTRAETLILAALRDFYPGIPIVAEEAAAANELPEEIGARFFLVDPLDGTREFINGNRDFTVNIALIEDGAPVCGVVHAPAHGEMYLGSPDGAFLVRLNAAQLHGEAPVREAIRVRICGAKPVAVASRSHRTPETDRYLTDNAISDCVSIGSSLKFCLLARGAADIYPRFGPTMEWDTAAGDAVLRAAGGSTVRTDGTPLTYGKRDTPGRAFANPDFIARSTR